MAFFKVLKTVQHTEEIWVEAENETEAEDKSGMISGERTGDAYDWMGSDAEECSEEEYNDNK